MSRFKKGHKAWNKGLTKETDERIKGHIEEAKRKIGLASKGHKCLEEAKRKISIANKGENNGMYGKPSWNKGLTKETDERVKKYSSKIIGHKFNLGRKWTKEHRGKISKSVEEDWKINRSKYNNRIKKIKEARAKQITPLQDTKIEIKIQTFLTQLGIEFFTHQYMKEIEHKYRCDIWVPSKNLVIECDGDYWHGNLKYFKEKELSKHQIEQRERDDIRTKELLEKGFNVLRLWENKIRRMKLKDFQDKIMEIK